MDQYIGKLLDNRYEIIELIGSGGMANVYKARCHRLNRLVAVKILRDDLAQDEELRRRFEDESQAVAMLSHPNIVAVYDVSRSSDIEYIVMELIDGITLKQYMQKRNNKLDWRESLHFITQIVKALGHAHSRNIIHRDIKPHNIMVLRDGSVKVADFGIARLLNSNHSTLTQEALGSVHYISPEQAKGSHIDARSDLYSAGVVLYEMITGRLPFEGDTPVSVAIQHINSIPLAPREINPDIPEALEAITMKAMAHNPDQRYVTADAMLNDLEEFRKNPNVNFEYSLADFFHSEALDEPTQILGVPSSGGAGKHSRRHAQDEYDDDVGEKHRVSGPVIAAIVAILLFIVGMFFFLWTSFFGPLLAPAESYVVPKVTGYTLAEIAVNPDILGDFVIEPGETVSDESPEGTIISQTPEADTVVKEGGMVITVTISSGVEPIVMTDVNNMEYREAKLLLQSDGLTVLTPIYQNSDEVARGYVISFTPEANETLEAGDEVQLWVSMGAEAKTVTLPSLVNKTLDRALSDLETFNLQKGSVVEVYDDTIASGYVVSQYPEATTEVNEGSTVNLQVSKGKDPSSVKKTEKTITINLPDTTDTVHVVVTVDNAIEYDSNIDCSMNSTIYPTISGSGVQTVAVYFDDVFQTSYPVDFSE